MRRSARDSRNRYLRKSAAEPFPTVPCTTCTLAAGFGRSGARYAYDSTRPLFPRSLGMLRVAQSEESVRDPRMPSSAAVLPAPGLTFGPDVECGASVPPRVDRARPALRPWPRGAGSTGRGPGAGQWFCPVPGSGGLFILRPGADPTGPASGPVIAYHTGPANSHLPCSDRVAWVADDYMGPAPDPLPSHPGPSAWPLRPGSGGPFLAPAGRPAV